MLQNQNGMSAFETSFILFTLSLLIISALKINLFFFDKKTELLEQHQLEWKKISQANVSRIV